MKNYARVSLILGAITLVCAVLIAAMNLLTSPVISSNQENTIAKTYQLIFSDYDKNESVEFTDSTGYIKSKVKALDKDGNLLGYIYTVSGKNSYGEISLMVGIKDNKVIDVEFLTNTESFASNVNEGLKKNYPSSKDSSIYIGFQPEEANQVPSLSIDDVKALEEKMNGSSKSDVTAGATYGAKTINTMIQAVLNEAKGVE